MKLWLETWGLWVRHPRERMKLLLGSLLYPRATQRWLAYLRQDALLWPQVVDFPKLVTRIYRPYGWRTLSCGERVAQMVAHHELQHRLGLRGVLSASLAAPLPLLALPTKGDDVAEAQFLSLRDGHREGEQHLQLLWNGQRLYTLSFLMREQQGQVQLLVTRLQGSQEAGTRERIRLATKGLHGCRPSVLLVQLARGFARAAGCQSVLLVSHRLRVALNPVRRRRLPDNLESLWQELGATPRGDGFFTLPPELVLPHDFSAVPSHKRAEARRRTDLLAQALQALDTRLRGAPLA